MDSLAVHVDRSSERLGQKHTAVLAARRIPPARMKTPGADPLESLGQRIESVAGVDPSATSRQERIDITKIALKEAIKEWCDDRVRDLGRWSLRGIALSAFGALVYFILTHTGWTR